MQLERSTWQLYVLIVVGVTVAECYAISQGINGHCMALFIGLMALIIGKIWGATTSKKKENKDEESPN